MGYQAQFCGGLTLGKNKSTKAYLPLDLIHYEAYKNMDDHAQRIF